AIKVGVVLLVIIAGIGYVKRDNYSPFIPPSEGTAKGDGGFMGLPLVATIFGRDPSIYGFAGVISGAALVFFAFIGFDIVATPAEEAKDPQRNVPRGIIGSLAIVTLLYMAVSFVVTGVQS